MSTIIVPKEVISLLAYIDGGTASLFIQALAGGLAAAAVLAKIYWGRLLRFLHLRKPEEGQPAS